MKVSARERNKEREGIRRQGSALECFFLAKNTFLLCAGLKHLAAHGYSSLTVADPVRLSMDCVHPFQAKYSTAINKKCSVWTSLATPRARERVSSVFQPLTLQEAEICHDSCHGVRLSAALRTTGIAQVKFVDSTYKVMSIPN